MIARRSLCPEKLVSNPGQGSKGINFSGWHGLVKLQQTKSSPDPAGILSPAVPAGILLPVGSVGPIGPYGMMSPSDSESAILVDTGGGGGGGGLPLSDSGSTDPVMPTQMQSSSIVELVGPLGLWGRYFRVKMGQDCAQSV